MGDKTRIEWTDATWNPVTGCFPVSAGCANCYAKRMAERFPKTHGPAPWSDVDREVEFKDIIFHPDRLDQPLRWKKPRRIFVSSLGDLFHEDVKDEWIDKVMGVTRLAPQHTFIFLTKRPERMKRYFADSPGVAMVRANKEAQGMAKPRNFICPESPSVWPRHNLWLGVTAENQEMADQRIPILLQTPAAKRFVSVEPCLSVVDLPMEWLSPFKETDPLLNRTPRLDWIICGGESGPGARPMHPDWPRSLRDQCQAAGVPFFFKQWGEWTPVQAYCGPASKMHKWSCPAGTEPLMARVGKKTAGCLLDGREWKEFPK
jgi:protein gp37